MSRQEPLHAKFEEIEEVSLTLSLRLGTFPFSGCKTYQRHSSKLLPFSIDLLDCHYHLTKGLILSD